MVQSPVTTKSQAFDLVKNEIKQTVKRAEAALERFQENRDRSEDLGNCVDFIDQLRGMFTLLEFQGGILLCREIMPVAKAVPVGAGDEKNTLLTSLNSGLFILRRYVEYFDQQREDHPELLLPIINELREARRQAPYPESFFFNVDLQDRPDICATLRIQAFSGSEAEHRILARRMRLMFQVGLLGILQDRNDAVNKKLIGRSARGFARLCQDTPMGPLWCLVALVADTMLDCAMGFNKVRKRMLMAVEKVARTVVAGGVADGVAEREEAQDSLIRDLLYILYRSGSANPEVLEILSALHLAPADFPESRFEAHAQRLYGPGSDVLQSLTTALQDELNPLKDKLDILERGIEPDPAELLSIAEALERLAHTLVMLDLGRLAGLAKQEAAKLRRWQIQSRLPGDGELFHLADSVLTIEDAITQIVSRGTTSEVNALAGDDIGQEASVYLQEARYLVADEARSALTLAKRGMTAFVESDYDKLHLANLPAALHSIRGGLQMLNDSAAAHVMERVTASIQTRLLDALEPPAAQVLEALADALASLEYYVENSNKSTDRNGDLLTLAESSLDDVGL